MKFRKKPVVIDAIQFTGENVSECLLFCKGINRATGHRNSDGQPYIKIATLEGDMIAGPGDWIIKGVKGEFYPCKPDIFDTTYEPVEVA